VSVPRKAALAAEILLTYVRVRWLLPRTDLRRAVAALKGASTPGAPADPVDAGRRLGRAVVRTLGVLPTDSRCLMRSLVLTALLARRGIEPRLVVGVRPGETLLAHAWVEHGGQALLDPGGGRFERLLEL
jgi:hypothetical protein